MKNLFLAIALIVSSVAFGQYTYTATVTNKASISYGYVLRGAYQSGELGAGESYSVTTSSPITFSAAAIAWKGGATTLKVVVTHNGVVVYRKTQTGGVVSFAVKKTFK